MINYTVLVIYKDIIVRNLVIKHADQSLVTENRKDFNPL